MPRIQASEQGQRVTVIDAFITETAKGTLGIYFLFQDDNGDNIGATRWVTPAAVERTIQDCETLGFSRTLMADMANLDKISDFVRGRACSIVVEEKEYKGTLTPTVKWINPVGGGKRVTDSDAKSRMFALLNGQVPSGGPAPHAPVSDDDVPF